jgi:hypothetical protein
MGPRSVPYYASDIDPFRTPLSFMHLTALEEAEIIPGKHSDTRIKPLAFTNGHGRYINITPERTLASVGECFGRFTSETAV